MNYNGVPTPIVRSDSKQVLLEFCDNADLPLCLQGGHPCRKQLHSNVVDNLRNYRFFAYTTSQNPATKTTLKMACNSKFDVVHKMVKKSNLEHHVQPPCAPRRHSKVQVPIEQSDVIAIESNGHPSFLDLKNNTPPEPCKILYSTTNSPLITSHPTREHLIANDSHGDYKGHFFLKIPNLVSDLEKCDIHNQNYVDGFDFDHRNRVVILGPVHLEGNNIYFTVMSLTSSTTDSYQWYFVRSIQCCLSMFALVEREGIAPMKPMAFCPHIFVDGRIVTRLGRWTLCGVLYFYHNPRWFQERFYMNEMGVKVYGRGHLIGVDMGLAIPRMERLLRMVDRLMTAEVGLIDQIENLIEHHDNATFGIEEENAGEVVFDDEDSEEDEEIDDEESDDEE